MLYIKEKSEKKFPDFFARAKGDLCA